ncbi:hypothetical protein LUX57_47880 [Actinomadura madurae]|uniref:PEP/pyruvate-binding domain-containing protein n=1 Tax=Actinomadura madurae TaxID=1993 RepID=UPI0020D23582|nr:PEP/pyruvate-binding domain-containing protein [Actinomadura madurae]MCP9971855.1 hypothetical protein [Actinomadura madurae]
MRLLTLAPRLLFTAGAGTAAAGIVLHAGRDGGAEAHAAFLLAGYLGWLLLEAPVTFRRAAAPPSDARTLPPYGLARLLLVAAASFGPLPWERWSPWLLVPSAAFAAGVALRRAAIRALGRFYSHHVMRQDGHRVVTGGLYGIVRHPAYAGMLLAHIGFTCFFLGPAGRGGAAPAGRRRGLADPGGGERALGRSRLCAVRRGHAARPAEGVVTMGEIGHKFARLEALRAAGFPVPGFFCLPADEFDRALASLRDALPQAASPPAADWCASAASALSRAVPSGDLADGLLEAFDALVGPGGTAAVRACAVPGEDGGAEDGEDDPFAGMSDSFLYVPRAGLLAAVARCWASAFKPEAVRYRILKGADPASARVAVGIQRMVPGTRSFVAFTRDPRDGTRRHVVAAAHGIGEGVVQEKADVDHFFVDPETGGVRAEIVLKRRMAGPPAAGESGTRVVPVPDALRHAPVLTDSEARDVADLAARVEEHFGRPQDIEGTITPDGTVHLVQARPLAGAARDAGARVYWGNHNITESFPGVSGALTYSQARAFYELAFTDLYRRMGVPGPAAARERAPAGADGRASRRPRPLPAGRLAGTARAAPRLRARPRGLGGGHGRDRRGAGVAAVAAGARRRRAARDGLARGRAPPRDRPVPALVGRPDGGGVRPGRPPARRAVPGRADRPVPAGVGRGVGALGRHARQRDLRAARHAGRHSAAAAVGGRRSRPARRSAVRGPREPLARRGPRRDRPRRARRRDPRLEGHAAGRPRRAY